MSGYTRIYCVGDEGGFMGADGINPIIIYVAELDRLDFDKDRSYKLEY